MEMDGGSAIEMPEFKVTTKPYKNLESLGDYLGVVKGAGIVGKTPELNESNPEWQKLKLALCTELRASIDSKVEPVPTSQLIGYDMVARKYIGRNQAYLLASAEKRAP